MINPIDRTTKKISIRNNPMFEELPDRYIETLYGQSFDRLPIAPNKKQLRERIRQHMVYSSVRQDVNNSL